MLYFHNSGNIEYKAAAMPLNAPDAVTRLAALAQETRLAIFRLLVQQGPEGLPVNRIGEALDGLPGSTLSFHLKELQHAGLVCSRQEGRSVIYSAHYPAMSELIGFLTANCCGGEACELTPNAAAAACC
jgi:ArsR family transcriptional regulator